MVVVVGAPLFTVVGRRGGFACFHSGWSWWRVRVFSKWLVVVVDVAVLTMVGHGGGCSCFDGGWVVVLVTKGNTFCLCLVFDYFSGV